MQSSIGISLTSHHPLRHQDCGQQTSLIWSALTWKSPSGMCRRRFEGQHQMNSVLLVFSCNRMDLTHCTETRCCKYISCCYIVFQCNASDPVYTKSAILSAACAGDACYQSLSVKSRPHCLHVERIHVESDM